MGACVLTHTVQLQYREVDRHEVVQHLAVDRCCTTDEVPAALQAKDFSYFMEDKKIGDCPAPWHWLTERRRRKRRRGKGGRELERIRKENTEGYRGKKGEGKDRKQWKKEEKR